VIGITASEHVASWGVWKEETALVTVAYVRSVAAAGGIPVVLAPVPGTAEALIERIDGLMLTGGADLDPTRYGAERHPKTQRPSPARDEFEIELLAAACERAMPVLAICRGLQVLNVARGGTLHQHLPDVVGNETHMSVPGTYGRHSVRVEPDSAVGRMLGQAASVVPAHHHQGVDRIGRGLVPTAWADDGIVEALEDPNYPFLLGVQWHPEVGDDPSLFDGFVAAATKAELLERA
jgi:putative glutamine amidotransferase